MSTEPSKWEENLLAALRLYGRDIPQPVREYRAVEGRRFRWDLAWPEHRLLVEINGGIYTRGRSGHTGASLAKDFDKLNAATVAGWRSLVFGPMDCKPRLLMATVETIRRAINGAS